MIGPGSASPGSDCFRDACRRHGLKVTRQRELIYRVMRRANNHPTAEQVYDQVHKIQPSLTLDTVHRTLSSFARAGLVRIVEGFAHARRYDPVTTPHHHLHCLLCDLIVDFEEASFDRLETRARLPRGFEVLYSRVVMAGVCPECRRESDEK